MYDRVRANYLAGKMTDSQLDACVNPKKWITQEQADQIRADKAAQDAQSAEAVLTE